MSKITLLGLGSAGSVATTPFTGTQGTCTPTERATLADHAPAASTTCLASRRSPSLVSAS